MTPRRRRRPALGAAAAPERGGPGPGDGGVGAAAAALGIARRGPQRTRHRAHRVLRLLHGHDGRDGRVTTAAAAARGAAAVASSVLGDGGGRDVTAAAAPAVAAPARGGRGDGGGGDAIATAAPAVIRGELAAGRGQGRRGGALVHAHDPGPVQLGAVGVRDGDAQGQLPLRPVARHQAGGVRGRGARGGGGGSVRRAIVGAARCGRGRAGRRQAYDLQRGHGAVPPGLEDGPKAAPPQQGADLQVGDVGPGRLRRGRRVPATGARGGGRQGGVGRG